MHQELKKYDKKAYKVMEVPIEKLNQIFVDTNTPLKIRGKYESLDTAYQEYLDYMKECDPYAPVLRKFDYFLEHHKAKIEVEVRSNEPALVLASKVLGIRIYDWAWDEDTGNSVIIKYR